MFSAIILAAGLATRMGRPKLLLPLNGKSIIRWTVEHVFQAGKNEWEEVIVVLGRERRGVERELEGLPVRTILNPYFANGMSTSLQIGLQAVPNAVSGAMIFLGDQPLLPSQVVPCMIATYRETRKPIVVPTYGQERGHPVLFERSIFSDLLAIEGDKGASQIINRYPELVATVRFSSSLAPKDVDTQEDYEAMCAVFEQKHYVPEQGMEGEIP